MRPIRSSGTNFSTVVTSWMIPDSRAPAKFASVSTQMTERPRVNASALLVPRLGQKTLA